MNENQPLYLKLYNSLYDKIVSGEYSEGEKLPTEKELAEQFNVSNITSKKSLEMLADNGMIKRVPGKGSFVIKSTVDNKIIVQKSKSNSPIIGVVLSDFSESYGTNLLSGIEEEASKNNCFIIPKRSYGKQELENDAIDSLVDMGVDGIIVMPVHGEHYNPKILKLIIDGYPLVLMDCDLKGIQAAFVGTDNVDAAKMATDYLLEHRHRKISFISTNPKDTTAIEDRIKGFIISYAEHGVKVDETIWETNLVSTLPGMDTESNIEADCDKIKKMIINNSDITCIFVTEYNLALLVMRALKHLNKAVPEDISILCFDGPYNNIGDYFFTHIRQKEKQIGCTSVQFVLKLIRGEIVDKTYLKAILVTGQSVRDIRVDGNKKSL
ncbi:GntR family transcriptional regulator [Clostridium beijerinckii]|uniref:GntR family transcriptional regulator n=1 Tax=Clostridium beijerinckii TaxID=1520 RepID=UPI00080A1DE7|nr:GntR family transcriptional regulator [Clostridium beijerinckii]OCA96439.1 GntR family transcriptional regulator [Clostridium beijerinckii]